MAKMEMNYDQGPCGPMAEAMGHHLPNLCREAAEPIRSARPRRQHHHEGGNRNIMKHQIALVARLL
jgi:hypothetical protein